MLMGLATTRGNPAAAATMTTEGTAGKPLTASGGDRATGAARARRRIPQGPADATGARTGTVSAVARAPVTGAKTAMARAEGEGDLGTTRTPGVRGGTQTTQTQTRKRTARAS